MFKWQHTHKVHGDSFLCIWRAPCICEYFKIEHEVGVTDKTNIGNCIRLLPTKVKAPYS